jgi:hypothetical protein
MKVTTRNATSFTGLQSVAVLSSGAIAQDNRPEAAREVHLISSSSPRERQIELALSAAPTEVSSKAAVYILGAKGYEKAREGTNGFSCLVERSFKRGSPDILRTGVLRRRGQSKHNGCLPMEVQKWAQ